MPVKGHAFDKPSVNALHKEEVKRLAKLASANESEPREGIEAELFARINESNMGEARKKDARDAVTHAVNKLLVNVDPLSGYSPPDSCRACTGANR